jgi:PAS domain S-box-containing protein
MASLDDSTHTIGLGKPDWLPHLTAALITLASITLIALLWRNLGALRNPEVLMLLTVALCTFIAGGMAGMLSAAIVLLSSFALYSSPAYSFQYTDMDWRQAMLVVVASPLIALMVGSLKEQADRLRTVTEENEHLKGEIDRHRRMGNLLHLSEERFRLAADAVPGHAIVVLDVNGIVKTWNPGAEAITGYGAQEIVGQSYSRFFIKDDILGRQPNRLLEIAQFSGRIEEKGWRLAKSGARFWASTTMAAVRPTAGPITGFVMVMGDLTERAKLEDSLVKTRAELEALNQGRG